MPTFAKPLAYLADTLRAVPTAIEWLVSADLPNPDQTARDLAQWLWWLDSRHSLPLDPSRTDLAQFIRLLRAMHAPEAIARRKLTNIAALYAFADSPHREALATAAAKYTSHMTGFLDLPDAAELIAAADQLDPRPALLLWLPLAEGLSLTELQSATVENLHSYGRHLALHPSASQHHAREPVVIADPLVRLIRHAMAGRTHGPLLVDLGRKPIATKTISRLLDNLAAAAGLSDRVTIPLLRTTYIAIALDQAVPLPAIASSVGLLTFPANPSRTQIYAALRRSPAHTVAATITAHRLTRRSART
jgi:site-specific recombinase XerD